MIDLHMHSTFSDGSLTPEELARKGKEQGLTVMALTDHDCTDGVQRFVEACTEVGVTALPGVEISAEVEKGTLHMLGYMVEPGHPVLEGVLMRIRNGRELRNRAILRKLQGMGMDLTWEDVSSYAGEEVVGRPHFALAMVAKGYVSTKKEVFNRYLAKGKCAYVDRFRLTPAESMYAIARGGGVSVLSHPFTLDLGKTKLREFVGNLKDQGLQGIEAYYSEHSPEQTRQYLDLAKEFDLVATGGSDFHGEANPAIHLGSGFGSLVVPDTVYGELQERQKAVRAAMQ